MSTRHIPLAPLARAVRSFGSIVFAAVATLLMTVAAATSQPARPVGCRRARPIATAAPRRWSGASGQATTEYALILLAAALVGLLVVAWATAGGAAGRIGQLFDTVVDSVISRV